MNVSPFFTIAITRTCGSGGTTIGKMLSDHYGIDIYDRKLLQLAAEDSGINESLFAMADESMKNTLLYKVHKEIYNGELIPPESGNFTSDNNLFNYQAKILKELAQKESYVVIGRCADYILRNNPNTISVYLYADEETCIDHIVESMDMRRNDAARYIKKNDKYRSEYYTYHTGKKWKIAENYDLCLNTEKLGYEKCVSYIIDYVKLRTGITKDVK